MCVDARLTHRWLVSFVITFSKGNVLEVVEFLPFGWWAYRGFLCSSETSGRPDALYFLSFGFAAGFIWTNLASHGSKISTHEHMVLFSYSQIFCVWAWIASPGFGSVRYYPSPGGYSKTFAHFSCATYQWILLCTIFSHVFAHWNSRSRNSHACQPTRHR